MDQETTDKELPPRVYAKAVDLASNSTMRFQLGAVVFKKNKILGFGVNERRTHPEFGSAPYYCLHAECNSIRKALMRGNSVAGADIFVYRRNNNCSKPCDSCKDKFISYGIRRVYYIDREGNIRRMYP